MKIPARAYCALVIGALFAASIVNFIVASNEFILQASVLAFLALSSSLLLVAYIIKLPLFVSISFSAIFLGLIKINQVKYGYLREVFHPIDALLMWRWVRDDFSLIHTYPGVFIASLGVVALVLFVLFVSIALDLRNAKQSGFNLGSRLVATILSISFLSTVSSFFTGYYYTGVNNLQYYSQLSVNTGVRISYLAHSFEQMLDVKNDVKAMFANDGADSESSNQTISIKCARECPDVIVYHVESVFDPINLNEYKDVSPITFSFNQNLNSMNGYLRTNVFGGRSMISEFELLCGQSHRPLGMAGSYPNLFLAPFLSNCMPERLKNAGYKTIALYSTDSKTNHAGRMFASYGFEQFLDAKELNLPNEWSQIRDGLLIEKALSILAAPSDRPRMIFVSGMHNHGPHNKNKIGSLYPGPYDASKASNGAVADYINRLNDSLSQFKALETKLGDQKRRVALLYYGDHQPSIGATYSPVALDNFAADMPFITFYRMADNWRKGGSSESSEVKDITSLVGSFLHWSGIQTPVQEATERDRGAVKARHGHQP